MVELALSLVLLGQPISIKFDAVTSDNRCPAPPVRCSGAGNAEVRVVLPDGKKVTLLIPGVHQEAPPGIYGSPEHGTNFFYVRDRAFLLTKLSPLPTTGGPPTSYRATITETPPPVGVASLDKFETITLRLRKILVKVPKGDPRHLPLLKHLGGLYVGREKPVLPGPEVPE